jgi:hypothetical protein
MNQKTRILIVGHGRVAGALLRVVQSLPCEWRQISGRSLPVELAEASAWATHVYIAVPDRAIQQVVDCCQSSKARLIHFAAAVSVPGTSRWHPLAAFGDQSPQPQDFNRVLFVGEAGQDFANDFPNFVNEYFFLPASDFLRYHALCFLGVGLTMGPIKHAFKALKDLGLPEPALKEFFSSAFASFLDQPQAPTSGPHTRRDFVTLEAHQTALQSESLYWYQQLIKGAQL